MVTGKRKARPGGREWRRRIVARHKAGKHTHPRTRCPVCRAEAAVRATNGTAPAAEEQDITARSVLMAMLGGIDGGDLPPDNRRTLHAVRRAVLVLVEEQETVDWNTATH